MWKMVLLVLAALIVLPQIINWVIFLVCLIISGIGEIIKAIVNKRKNNKLRQPESKSEHGKRAGSTIALAVYYITIPILTFCVCAFAYGCGLLEAFLITLINTALTFVVATSPFLIFRYCIYKKKMNVVLSHIISFAYVFLVSFLVSEFLFTDYNMGWINIFINAAILYCGEDTREVKANNTQKETVRTVVATNVSTEPNEYELQMRRDYNRYTYLRDEVNKIPLEDVKQWYEDGKITDVQYDEILSAYNSLKNEMEEIRQRVRVINQARSHKSEEN